MWVLVLVLLFLLLLVLLKKGTLCISQYGTIHIYSIALAPFRLGRSTCLSSFVSLSLGLESERARAQRSNGARWERYSALGRKSKQMRQSEATTVDLGSKSCVSAGDMRMMEDLYTHLTQNYQRPLGSVGSVDIGNTSSIWRGLSINSRCTLRYVRTPWSRCKLLINKPIPIGCTHLRAGRNHTGPCCVVRWFRW